MSNQEQELAYADSWRKIISTPWLFPPHYSGAVDMGEYMKAFEQITGGVFYCFRGPQSYDISVLDQWKERIVITNQMFAADGRSWLDTIIQLSPRVHLVCNWAWSVGEKKHKISVGLYVKDPATYAAFLKENERFEFKEGPRNAGFGNPMGGHFGSAQ